MSDRSQFFIGASPCGNSNYSLVARYSFCTKQKHFKNKYVFRNVSSWTWANNANRPLGKGPFCSGLPVQIASGELSDRSLLAFHQGIVLPQFELFGIPLVARYSFCTKQKHFKKKYVFRNISPWTWANNTSRLLDQCPSSAAFQCKSPLEKFWIGHSFTLGHRPAVLLIVWNSSRGVLFILR